MADSATDTVTETELPALTITVADSGPARKTLTIEIPTERIEAKIQNGFDSLQNDAVLPGFRKGRAPKRLLHKRFGTSVRDDAKGQLISESYTEAIEKESLEVLGEPDVKDAENIELPESGPLKFEVEVEVSPDFEMPSLEGIKANKPVATIDDAAVDKELDSLRERFGKMTEVPDAEIKEDDYVLTDTHILAGENAGDDAEVLGHHHDAYMLIGGESREYKGHVAGILVNDLGKLAAGKKIGEELVISMTGPESHENEKIKGAPITLKIAIKQVQRVEPAEMSALLEQSGEESEEKLRERIKESLESRSQRDQQTALREQVETHLLDSVEMALPEGISGRQTDRLLRRRAMEMNYQGASEQDVEARLAEMRSESEEQAARELKLFFILEKAAKQLEIEVAENELNGQIAMMAMQQGRRPEKLRQEMLRNGQLDYLYLQVREQKTLDKILEKAEITETEVKAGDNAEASDSKKKTTKKKTTKKSTKAKAEAEAEAEDKGSDDA